MITTPSFWYQKKSGIMSTALTPISWIYHGFSHRRIHKKPRYKSKLPVICVGNLTAGGSGKTPVVTSLCKLLQQAGKNPNILSRGYGAKLKNMTKVNQEIHTAKEVGDEPYMHAKDFDCWISADRVRGAKMIETDPKVDVIVMDDGFQNPYLYKNLNIVVVDGVVGFGNEQLIPAGPLREPIENGIKRADALIIIGDDRHYLTERFSYLLPVFQAHLIPDFETHTWKGKKVIGFTGIGRPEKFRNTLLSIGVKLKEFVPFADHHFFSLSDINRLLNLAKKHGAKLVTTEKDWGRLPLSFQDTIAAIPIKVKWKNEKALHEFLTEKGIL